MRIPPDAAATPPLPVPAVVLVHGIFDTAVVFRRMAAFLQSQGFQTYAPTLRPSTGAKGLDELAAQLHAYIEATVPAGQPIQLVGFSMGGLICRYYVQRLAGNRLVRRFITLAAPHHGSWLALLLPNAGGRQMRPNSSFLTELNENLDTLEAAGIVSIWTPWDLAIVPARSSRLPVGEEIRLPVKLHPLLLQDARSLRAVAGLLGAEVG